MKRVAIDVDDVQRIDGGDESEVVFATDFEMPVVKIQSTVWAEAPFYLAFVGTEPERQIQNLITALGELLESTTTAAIIRRAARR